MAGRTTIIKSYFSKQECSLMRMFLFYAKKEAAIRLSLKYMVEKYTSTTNRFAQQL